MDSLELLPFQPDETSESKTLRVFLSLNPEPQTLERIATIQSRLRDHLEKTSVSENLRWTRTSQLHLTLLFFGNISKANAGGIASELAKMKLPAPVLTLTGISSFPKVRHPKVIWLGVETDKPFRELQSKLIQSFAVPFGLDSAPSYPHITLARVRPAPGKKGLEMDLSDTLQSFEGAEIGWRPDSISLMRSDTGPNGMVYHAIASVPLLL